MPPTEIQPSVKTSHLCHELRITRIDGRDLHLRDMRTEFWQVRMLTARTKQQDTLMFSCHLVSPNQDLVSFRKRNHRSMGQGEALEEVQGIWVRLNNQSYLPVLMSLIRSCIQ